jgi:cytochrome c biogenesis protein CcdA
MPDENGGSLGRQFVIGSLLGLVWLPCVGPTLGAALVLASQGHALAEVAAVMLAFAVGAALPLSIIGTISAKALANRRRAMAMVGARGRVILGTALAIAGILILTGADRRIEAALTTASPDWLVAVTTRY